MSWKLKEGRLRFYIGSGSDAHSFYFSRELVQSVQERNLGSLEVDHLKNIGDNR